MNSVSVIITSSHEPKTIGRALKTVLEQDSPQIIEILVISPDEETLTAAKKAAANHLKVIFIKDPGKGKPSALNLAFQKSTGEILVLTDGDVYVSPSALSHLLKPFIDSQVGGTCGRPISINPKDDMLGFWSHFLTDTAHQIRLDYFQKNQFIELSGYLLAIRKRLIKEIPPETLADDLFLSNLIAKAGSKTVYTPKAGVFVKYPTTLSDWFRQKKRTSFEYMQNSYSSGQKMRTPLKETLYGLKFALTYFKNLKEFFWLILLFKARFLLWLQIFLIKTNPSSSRKLWQPIKSTK